MSNLSQPDGTSLSLSEVEAVLAAVSDVKSDRRNTFQYRLKNLLKVGLLPHVPAGRGKTAKYDCCDLFEFAVAVELLQFGLGPERAVAQIGRLKGGLRKGATAAAKDVTGQSGIPIFLRFDPFELERMTAEIGSDWQFFDGYHEGPSPEADALERRIALINLARLSEAIVLALHELKIMTPTEYADGLSAGVQAGRWTEDTGP